MQKKNGKTYVRFNENEKTVYGRLTLTGDFFFKEKYGKRYRLVEAKCECGNIGFYKFTKLNQGETKSCGCLRKEVSRDRMTTHGKSGHLLKFVWQSVKQRCKNPNNKGYHNYGGRGIRICDEWDNSYEKFFDWCIANGWQEGLEIDRIDNNGNYEPSNCRFVGRPINVRNKRDNRNLTAFGETKCMRDWSNDPRCKVSFPCLRSRIDRAGWTDIEAALTAPHVDKKESSRNGKRAKMFTAWGETKCMASWLDDSRCLVKIDSFRERIAKGWDAERVMSTPPSSSGVKGIKNIAVISPARL